MNPVKHYQLNELLEFLQINSLEYERIDHEPLFTCEQAALALIGVPGGRTKNLFLRDDKGRRHFLVTTTETKKLDLKALEKIIGSKGLGFASAERLKKFLGVEPGSVTLLAVINDPENAVEVFIDTDLQKMDTIMCHPLINTSTLVLQHNVLLRYLELLKHNFCWLSLPET